MATFAYTNSFSAGDVIVADEITANFNNVRTFVTGANLTTDNLATPYSNIVFQLFFGDVAHSATEVRRFKIPSAQAVVWVEAQVGRAAGGGTATLQFTDDTSNVLSSSLASSSNDETVTSTGFAISSSAGGSEIVVTIVGSGSNPSNDVCVTLWAKVLLRS